MLVKLIVGSVLAVALGANTTLAEANSNGDSTRHDVNQDRSQAELARISQEIAKLQMTQEHLAREIARLAELQADLLNDGPGGRGDMDRGQDGDKHNGPRGNDAGQDGDKNIGPRGDKDKGPKGDKNIGPHGDKDKGQDGDKNIGPHGDKDKSPRGNKDSGR
jgi:hypothetical protein